MRSPFAGPVRVDVTVAQSTKDRLEWLARRREMLAGAVLGELVNAEVARVTGVAADSAGPAGAPPGAPALRTAQQPVAG